MDTTLKSNVEVLEASPFEIAWINYVNSLRKLLTPIPDNRGMDQYLDFRDKVLKYALSPLFVSDLQKEWDNNYSDNREVLDLLLLELQAFPRAIEVAAAEALKDEEDDKVFEKVEKRKRKWWQRGWLGRASTVAGSVKDIFDKLPWAAKSGLTVLKELLDLFKGD